MFRSLFASMMVFAPMFRVSGEVGKEDKSLYELRTYHAAPGKLEALLTRFRNHTVKLFEKHGMRNVGYWVPVENKDNLLIYLLAYPDKESRDASWKAFAEDPEWKKAAADSEADGKLVAKADSLFLKPTDFSPPFDDPFEPRVGVLFEMRTYTATTRNLPNLLVRFRDHTMALFAKHGIANMGYFRLAPGQPAADDTLLYFLAHKDMDAATKSWADFRADPDWLAAKKASEEKAGGSLTTEGGVVSLLLKPTDFSPVK